MGTRERDDLRIVPFLFACGAVLAQDVRIMSTRSALIAVSCVSVIVCSAFAQTTPSTQPVVATTSIALTGSATVVTLDGYLAPVDPFEAKLKPKAFAGPFKVKSVVPHGTAVKVNDTLVQFDTTDLDEAIVAATSELEVARAAQVKQSIDSTLAEQNDAQALTIATDALSDAQLALDCWNKNDSPKFL